MMIVVRNLYDLRMEIDDIGREDNIFLNQAHGEVLARITSLWHTIEEIAIEPRAEMQEEKTAPAFSKCGRRGQGLYSSERRCDLPP